MRAAESILTVAQVQVAEQALFDAGMEPYALMQRAGRAAAEWVWRICAGRSVTVLCGPGNNGGDGYVIAQKLHERGCEVAVLAAFDPTTEDAKRAKQDFAGRILPASADRTADVFVDCLFGSGQNRPLSQQLAATISNLRDRHDRAIAVDLPSGIGSDCAELFNDIRAFDATLALGAWKWAHWAMPTAPLMGRRTLLDIGLGELGNGTKVLQRPHFTSPGHDAHKYTRGLVAIVAGGMPGAASLCARAAQFGGAGYVKLLADGRDSISVPDSIVLDSGNISRSLSDERIGAVGIGPGLGRDGTAAALLEEVLGAVGDTPAVLDADALHLLTPELRSRIGGALVLTPHEGELRALETAFACDLPETRDRPEKVQRAQAVARATEAIVVAKGADTTVCDRGDRVAVAPSAPSWLATAGTGDVLAGLVGSRLATGAEAFEAACEAVWLHGEAARIHGPMLTADSLIKHLPQAFAECL